MLVIKNFTIKKGHTLRFRKAKRNLKKQI